MFRYKVGRHAFRSIETPMNISTQIRMRLSDGREVQMAMQG